MEVAIKGQKVLIIGGGPAGISAGLWCRELGLDALIIEGGDDIGGQLPSIYNRIDNYVGLSAANGREMLEHFRETADRAAIPRMYGSVVTSIESERQLVHLADGKELNWSALIIATGVRRRRLNIPGETEFVGRGVLRSGMLERESVAGKRVLIVGGGDAAFENASLLAEFAETVTVAYRREHPTAREEFQRAAAALANVIQLPRTILKSIVGEANVEEVELEDLGTGVLRTEPAEAVLIRIGVLPNSEFVRGMLDLDDDGYIAIDSNSNTNTPGVFAAGDVAYPLSLTISTATGSGSLAAQAAYRFLSGQNEV